MYYVLYTTLTNTSCTTRFNDQKHVCFISGFLHDVYETISLLGYYGA